VRLRQFDETAVAAARAAGSTIRVVDLSGEEELLGDRFAAAGNCGLITLLL